MKFPNIVYITPGPHLRPGGTFNCKGVSDQQELDTALKEGWFRTLADAVTKKHSDVPADGETEVLGDSAPPTRKELEQKAKELSIKFDKKTTDEELSKKIQEALGV